MRKSSKGFKYKPKQALTESQLTESMQIIAQSLNDDPTIFDLPESKRTVDDIINFFMKIMEGDNIQRLLPKEKQQVAVDKNITKRKLADARADLRRHNDLYAKYQQLQVESPDDYKRYRKGKLEYHQEVMIQNKAIITKLERELAKLNSSLPTHKEFVKLVNSYLETILSTIDIIEEDMIYNKLVLKLRADNNAVSVINLNPPYNLIVDLEKIPFGWGGGTRTPACQDQNLVPYQLGYTPLCE